MKPILFQFGSISIYSYYAIPLLGSLFVLWLALRRAKKNKWPPLHLCIKVSILTFILGLAGAKLLFLFHHLDLLLAKTMDLQHTFNGGYTMYGHLFTAIIIVSLYAKAYKESSLRGLDFFLPYLAFIYVFIRLGCFLNGCCFGVVCELPWAMQFPSSAGPAHPVQIYEMILYFLIFGFLYRLHEKKDFDGQIMALFLMFFACVRLLTEIIRIDSHPDWVMLNFNQVLSILTLAAGWSLYFFLHRRFEASSRK